MAERNLDPSIEKLRPQIIKVLKKYGVRKAGIFGSYARGEQRRGSDIDLLVDIPDKSLSLIDFIKIKQALEEKTKRKIDLVEYNAVKLCIRESMMKDEIRIL